MEDDCWVEKGEFDSQQGWRMTAGRRGVSLTASRGGGWPLGGKGGVWPPEGGKQEDDLRVEVYWSLGGEVEIDCEEEWEQAEVRIGIEQVLRADNLWCGIFYDDF